MKIYFTLYLIRVVIFSLLVFWWLRKDTHRLIFMLVVSVAVLGALHPIFAAVALGLVLVTHQLVEATRKKRLRGARARAHRHHHRPRHAGHRQVRPARRSRTLVVRGRLVVTRPDHAARRQLFVFRMLQYVFDCARGVIKENDFLGSPR